MKIVETENYIFKNSGDGRFAVFYKDTEESMIATAKELFEELGYEQIIYKTHILYSNNDKSIAFITKLTPYYNEKTILISNEECDLTQCIKMKELKAINKQVEELHWYE